MRSFALTAVGADRPGIIAAVAECLLDHGMNVTDSNMGILRGYFATTLVVGFFVHRRNRARHQGPIVLGARQVAGARPHPVEEPA